ncbi:MAG: hypothetical protein JW712_02470 [Dehalococcoidales bacterium]|nr:hypothetical protein [Dehalococcoidales bacterium]
MQDWLSVLRDDVKRITTEAAMAVWPGTDGEPYYNYRLEHVQQAEREAKRLLALVGGDEDIVMASVWIHDRFQPQYEGEKHSEKGADWAKNNLAALGFPADKVSLVEYAVGNHSNPHGTIPEQYHEARMLWDADKLSHLGALAIITMLCGNPAFPQTKVSYEWVRQRMSEKMAKAKDWGDQFYFGPSRQWAKQRLKTQRVFYESLENELGD